MFFSKNIGKSISGKYTQKLIASAKKSATGAFKTGALKRKRAIQKVVGDSIGSKIIRTTSQNASSESITRIVLTII